MYQSTNKDFITFLLGLLILISIQEAWIFKFFWQLRLKMFPMFDWLLYNCYVCWSQTIYLVQGNFLPTVCNPILFYTSMTSY